MTEAPQPNRGLPLWPAVLVGLSLLGSLLVVYWQSEVFGPLLLALALAYSLEPLVQLLCQKGWSRLPAVLTVLAAGALCGGLLLAFLAVETAHLLEDLSHSEGNGRVQQGLQAAVDWVAQLLGQDAGLHPNISEVFEKAVPKLGDHVPTVVSFLKGLVAALQQSFSGIGVLVLLPVYLFYFMLELPRIWAWFKEHLPSYDQERSLRVLNRLHAGMSAFLRGRLLLAFLKGAVTVVGLALCGTPMAVVVGMGAGFLSIIPVVGPALGFAVALALTLAEGVALWPVLGVVLVFAVAEVLENFVLTPLVMRDDADLHPLVLIFCVVFWGSVLGAVGALAAIPFTLALRVLFQEYLQPALRDLNRAMAD